LQGRDRSVDLDITQGEKHGKEDCWLH